jgi:GNAT superfamily N-acetyltransferase
MPPRLRLRELLAPGDPAVQRAYRMLQETFPTSELIRAAEFVRAITERAAGAWSDLLWHAVVGERGPRMEGIATGTYLASLNVGFIGYLAVDQQRRAKGLGHQLRDTLLELFDGDAWRLLGRRVDAVVGEVEPDNPWLVTLVQRHQAIPLDIPYHQPPLRAKGPEVPLVLYYQPLAIPRQALPVAEVRQLLYSIWRYAYKVANPFGEETFRRMMQSLVGREEVGPMVLAGLAEGVAEG